jgi:hypothetical protein
LLAVLERLAAGPADSGPRASTMEQG